MKLNSERIERIAAGDRWVPASMDLGIALGVQQECALPEDPGGRAIESLYCQHVQPPLDLPDTRRRCLECVGFGGGRPDDPMSFALEDRRLLDDPEAMKLFKRSGREPWVIPDEV